MFTRAFSYILSTQLHSTTRMKSCTHWPQQGAG